MAIREVLEHLQRDEIRAKYGLSDLNIATITRWLANMTPVERAIESLWQDYDHDPRYVAIVIDDFFDQQEVYESFEATINFKSIEDLQGFLEKAFDNTGIDVELTPVELVTSDIRVFYIGDNGLIRMKDGKNGIIVVEYCLNED